MSDESTGNDIQSAVVLALRGSTLVKAIVGERIFDDVPHDQETIDTAFPRIVIDGQTERDASADDAYISEFTVTVHAYSRGLGKMQCQRMMHLIRQAVTGPPPGNTHASKTGKIVFMMFDFSDGPYRETDGKTYHGVVRFRGKIQY